jgi:peptidyl-tRNA hydrolase, PTH1 family
MESCVEKSYMIVGLGNPGKEYEQTRHNMGFFVVQGLARMWSWDFKKSSKLKGAIAKGKIGEKAVFLLLPETYMNLSGEAVRLGVDYFKIEMSHLLLVVDDVDIPFGEFRLKDQSGSGGHKGLQSVEMHLGCNSYPRLRIGIGDRKEGSLEEHVLSSFNLKEKEELPQILKEAALLIELWLNEGMLQAMNRANRSRKKI